MHSAESPTKPEDKIIDSASVSDQSENLISAHELTCVRGENQLFANLSLAVDKGQCLHIIGANGSGKTSLLRILSGLTMADGGQIYWQGIAIADSEVFFAQCAYVGHKDGLKNELTALENLRFYQQLDEVVDEDTLDNCLAEMKILHCADLPAQVLSFGQRRRLAFARLLLARKSLWILDEPFTGIDIQGRALIERLCVKHLNTGGAIVMTHHQSLENSKLSEFRTELHLDQEGAPITPVGEAATHQNASEATES